MLLKGWNDTQLVIFQVLASVLSRDDGGYWPANRAVTGGNPSREGPLHFQQDLAGKM